MVQGCTLVSVVRDPVITDLIMNAETISSNFDTPCNTVWKVSDWEQLHFQHEMMYNFEVYTVLGKKNGMPSVMNRCPLNSDLNITEAVHEEELQNMGNNSLSTRKLAKDCIEK